MAKKDIQLGEIVTWKPKDEDVIANNDGKLFILRFDKAFGIPKLGIYNKFFIKKASYEKQLDVICKYMNFFMKFYDDERELVSAYLKIKYAIDREQKFNENNSDQLIDLIYELLFTDSIVNKIYKIVEDNYLDDIESSDSKKYVMEKKHLESLEFTNNHIKILLRISFGMKLIAPIMFHYVSFNVIKLDKDSDLIYKFYRKLFDIFSDEVNIYNKLFTYVKHFASSYSDIGMKTSLIAGTSC